MFALRKKYFSNGKPRMTKKIEFEKLEISQNGQISGPGIFNFSNSNFFVIFGFPLKRFLFLEENILLSHQNKFEVYSINKEEDVL